MQLNFLSKLFGLPFPARPAPTPIKSDLTSTRTMKDSPELKTLWIKIRQGYFPERTDLDTYLVCWSRRRQKRVLGSCNIKRKVIHVAKELRDDRFQEWWEPLLYHEMCHAFIGLDVERTGRGRAWHGAEFKSLETKHPRTQALTTWIRNGGWQHAVRSERAKSANRRKKSPKRGP